MWWLGLLLSLANALELQGFLTSDCRSRVGITVNVSNKNVDFVNLDGRYERLDLDQIETIYIFNVIDNPIEQIDIDPQLLSHLRAVYTDDTKDPRTLAFPVRFIEDLVVFYSVDGKSHVYTYPDIFKIRPAPMWAKKVHRAATYKKTSFELMSQAGKCGGKSGDIKATRVLADKISISEFLNSLEDGFESLASFQERTYLYAKPFLYEKNTRLGLLFTGSREEPGINVPMYFQWSSGEVYRFQSFNAIGSKPHETLPNAEPVFSIRSDVKSHFFHGHFVGNVAGVPAGETIFFSSNVGLSGDVTVQPSFNYMALMGGDFGPYSGSVGFYFPTFGIKVKDEYREVLGTSVSYAFRGMYTKGPFRIRGIAAPTSYRSSRATKDDVVGKSSVNGSTFAPDTYRFDAVFVRGGIDYSFSERLKFGGDFISVTGSYKETVSGQSNDIRFRRSTGQIYVEQTFGRYVSLTGYANLIQHTFEANFLNQDNDREQRETRFFGTFEFVF
ncbi:MAG: hypothetical protein AB7F86_07510 [Bdellovibrionales bacterium]